MRTLIRLGGTEDESERMTRVNRSVKSSEGGNREING